MYAIRSYYERVGGQTVGPVQSGAGSFPNGIKTLDVGAPVKVCGHASAHIMGCRHHRDGLLGDIDAICQAFGMIV